MKTQLIAVTLILMLPCVARGQSGPAFEPYMFGGVSTISNSGGQAHVGAGLDVTVSNRLGAEAEVGWAGSDYGIGLVSADVLFRFRPRTGHRLMPYAAAGHTTSAFRGTARPFANVGIGTDVNVGHKAIRIEIREHAGLSEEWANRHIFGLRLGLVWTRG